MTAVGSNAVLAESAERAIELTLAPYIGSTTGSRKSLAETELRSISESLRRMGKTSWSRVPRLYTVLRIVNEVHVIESLIAEGVSDLSFPFHQKNLPNIIHKVSSRHEFLRVQALVLSKALDLERDDGRHRHFANAEDVPMIKIRDLGKGGFGYVDCVISTVTHKEYARKLIPRGRTFQSDAKVLRDYERELGHLKRLSHTHIVEFIGSYTDPRYVGIIMSPVADYNLNDFLALDPLPLNGRSLLRSSFGCLAAALCYLHDNEIRHKDIKPQNVLVKGHQIFLTDFGISLDWSELGQSTTTGLTEKTPRYCAPEVGKHLPRNSSSDLWSLGCVYLEIWSVLKGTSTTALLDYLGNHGSRSTCYYLNWDVSMAWCRGLEARLSSDENPPMSWIVGIAQLDPEIRWTARKLFDQIFETNEKSETRFMFAGLCCLEEDDSFESATSSIRSSRVFEDTGDLGQTMSKQAGKSTGGIVMQSGIADSNESQTMKQNAVEDRNGKAILTLPCLAKYEPGSLEEGEIKRPLQRRLVRAPCPGWRCDRNSVRDWKCSVCYDYIEYGYSDWYIYCDCGRSSFLAYSFKCDSRSHGSAFEKYAEHKFSLLLTSLAPYEFVNVLLIGERGVGKTTFINAFLNYLSFGTLEDAIEAESLRWAASCSFLASTLDHNLDIISQEIRVGSGETLPDGVDAPATDQCSIYPITVGTTTYRMIDTPGFLVTSDNGHDNKNLEHIISTISHLGELHGILFLLRAGDSRFATRSQSCMRSILGHLSRDFESKVVFGFTHTRPSGYTPGDTLASLKELLEVVRPNAALFSSSAMCTFDSESFRYIAALKSVTSVDGNRKDFSESWKHSKNEVWRILNIFDSTQPQSIKTVNMLKEFRKLSEPLSKLIMKISASIIQEIMQRDQDLDSLQQKRDEGERLRTKLHMIKKVLRHVALASPRLVCAHSACVDMADDGTGSNTRVSVYNSICHDVCYLEHVIPDSFPLPQSVVDRCAAFMGQDNCILCGHHWSVHIHTLYGLEPYETNVTDGEVAQKLEEHCKGISLLQAAVDDQLILIQEYSAEYQQIRDTTARISVWLTQNSLCHEDVLLAHYDSAIAEKRSRVQNGDVRELIALKRDRSAYGDFLRIVTETLEYDATYQQLHQNGPEPLMADLYKLKHFGKVLESVRPSKKENFFTWAPNQMGSRSAWPPS